MLIIAYSVEYLKGPTMFKRVIATYIACTILLNPALLLSRETSLHKDICGKYLTSTFGAEGSVVPPTPRKDLTLFEKFNKKFDAKRQILSPREAQEIAFDLVASHNNFALDSIDSSYIDKLNLVSGGENSQQHLISTILSGINTATGAAHTALSLCHPITDIALLQNRQKAILFLNENESLTEDIGFILKNTQQYETKSLMSWSSKIPVNQDILDFFYFGKNIDYKNILKSINTCTPLLEITNKTIQMGWLAFSALYGPCLVAYSFYNFARQRGLTCQELYATLSSEMAKLSPRDQTTVKICMIAPFAIQVPFLYAGIKNLQATGETINHVQNILIATASHVQELKRLSSLINQNKELLTYLPSLQPLADLNNPAKHSRKLNKLLSMLNTNTFKGDPSFWSISGRVLAAYELMKQVKDELAPVFAAAGELDMYVTLSKLYSSREGKEARYCMVNFVENSPTPIINAHNFWNPFINPDTVIVNDATLDASCPNSILTGPNTGGKSTVIKAITLNVLMAQTFGIAPSESLTITPFAKLNCFMNISDDIATGASLFKSEVMRAKKLLDMVQKLQPHEFSFVIIDEVFTGTSPQEGEMAALQFAKHLGTYKNNISIIATHYPKMVDLETETNGNYRNHHVEILRNEDGSLNRTFKLKNGPSFLNVAFDIIEEEGLFI